MSREPVRGGEGRSLLARQAMEAAAYTGILTACVTVLGVVGGQVLSAYFGCGPLDGLIVAKWILFFAGFGALGYGAVAMRPRSGLGSDVLDDEGGDAGDDSGTRLEEDAGPIQSATARVLSSPLGPTERLSTDWKVVLGGFAVLLVTVAMELVGLTLANYPCLA